MQRCEALWSASTCFTVSLQILLLSHEPFTGMSNSSWQNFSIATFRQTKNLLMA